jgi:putative transcriptional regulator
MDFARIIKDLRDEMLVTQTELAQKLGVSFATVNRWENGYHEPTIAAKRKIRDLCRKHGVRYE